MKKTLLFFIACLCLVLNAKAQTGVVRYNDNTQYSKDIHRMIETSDGGVLAIGGAGYEGLICKFSSTLNLIWTYSLDSAFFRDVIETNDGNYVMYADLSKANLQNNPLCIVKITPAGAVVFEKRFYDPSFVTGLTAVGLCKASGTDQGFLMFGGACMVGQYIMKCDVNGTIVWEKSNLGAGGGSVVSLIVDGNDYVGCFVYANNNMLHAGIFRLDASGTLLNCHGFQTNNTMQYLNNSIVKLNSGNFAIVTTFASSMGLAMYNVDPTFTNVTSYTINFATQTYMGGMFATHNSNDEIVICGGYNTGSGAALKINPVSGAIAFANFCPAVSAGFDNGMLLSNGDYAFCGSNGYLGGIIAEINPAGVGFCSSQTFAASSGANTFTNNTVTLSQTTIGVASSNYSFSIDPFTLTRSVLCGNVSTEDLEDQSLLIHAFPNPTQNTITISSDELPMETIRVLNIAGQEMETVSANGQTNFSLDLSDFASGIYFIEISSGENKFMRRIVRE